ncbi:hypothetical protein [Billgrantia aerodenitrificans]|uniref:Uncharacterized protein n=1 Tax=Billgrantia aerodenitrificans TaxID=2733483 RepID=A0ABS9AUZ6_9GAMM|nr:hypothetical protein [Halomonas aerodenitrificans]MCE8025491.1 hypothetical protein [Halomonas aerodenitrificans]
MAYQIGSNDSPRESFGEYKYRIYRDEVLAARHGHDCCSDEHGVDFITGKSETWPVGRMVDLLVGWGGSKPLILSRRAVAYMRKRLA